MPGSRRSLQKSAGSADSSASGVQRPTTPHYKLGDLGLVPRPTQNIPTSIDRTKGLSETTRLGSLKRVLTKSVGIQTVSAPKALFFADQLLSQASLTQQQAIIKDFKQKDQMSRRAISKVF
ncbi:C9orf117 [Bugula neritina]|uniref:C9orf117 n=1 Tax=Bugula neritina TaxID=10212 RepID=A0A7J7KJK0_BUGNE|nr:C9orf117 [Bugula neritina]